jgi:hypothetical protein
MVDTSVHLLGAIMTLLASPNVQKIDFQMGVQRINGPGFTAVKNAMYVRTQFSGHGIGVTVMSTPGAGGQYNPTTNNFELPFWHPSDEYSRMVIVHEAVHAMQDVRYGVQKNGGSVMTRSETEAAAYVAAALCFYYETGGYYEEDAISIVAAAIAKKLKDRPGAIASYSDTLVLRKIVASDPLYAGVLYEDTWADGVPGV